jgi:hypothetical protein
MNTETNPPWKAKRIYLNLIVAAGFVLFCNSLPALGKAFATLWAAPFVFWMIFRLCQAGSSCRRRQKSACLLRVGVWLSAFVLAFGMLAVRDAYRHQQAGTLVVKIMAYQEQHGSCPPTLEIIGENREARLGRRSNYFCRGGFVGLSYTVPSSGFDRYSYDFEHKTWNFHPD